MDQKSNEFIQSTRIYWAALVVYVLTLVSLLDCNSEDVRMISALVNIPCLFIFLYHMHKLVSFKDEMDGLVQEYANKFGQRFWGGYPRRYIYLFPLKQEQTNGLIIV